MRTDQIARDLAGAGLFLAGLLTAIPQAASAGASERETLTLLDVPFVAQTEELCGGAAAAMVLRYWGEQDILAEDFAPLLDASGSGIRGDVLADAARRRGRIAQSFRADDRSAKEHLARGRPLIVLVEDQPGHYHYLVLLGWLDGHVILHDPARAPFRVVAEAAFLAAWAATDFWTLLILPDPSVQGPAQNMRGELRTAEVVSSGLPADRCDALVGEGIRLARTGDRLSADVALSTALAQCPTSALAARELAGLRFIQSRWQDATRLAARAVARAPEDAHAWRLLASSRFIQDDVDGALRAWNRIGEPQIDLVRVDGLDRTRYAIAEELLSLRPRTELTVTGLRRARRRLAMLPVASATRVGYRPVAGGEAEIDAAIVERPRGPGRMRLAVMAAHALIERQVLFDVTPPTGSGTRGIASWRWWDARPRLGLSLLAPVAFGRSGLWRLEGSWEQQSYASSHAHGEHVVRDTRRRLALSYADWVAADTRVEMGMGLDRWNRAPAHVALFGSLERRLSEDRLAARVRGATWLALGRPASFGTGGLGLAWRSTSASTSRHQLLLTARAGVDAASAQAPFDVWPGADAGHARDVLLRAHPLLRSGVVEGGVFGRTLAHGGLELQAKTFTRGPVGVSTAVFGDVARAWAGFASIAAGRTQLDVGVGLRFFMAGDARAIRIDVARGLRDGQRALSVGWQLPWPGSC